MSKEKITEQELQTLTKEQLVSFIIKNLQDCNEGDAQVCVSEPPGNFATMKLPPRINVLGSNDYAPMNLKPIVPPPIPPNPNLPVHPKKEISDDQMVGEKKIFVKCERCDKTFIIDLPRRLVMANPLEVVPVTILHDDSHALTVYLDQNFESRRDYVSEIYVLNEYREKYKKCLENKD
ncbi:MAG: hypothetical protein ACTSUE_04625 [Promethearchaeota archaeon]